MNSKVLNKLKRRSSIWNLLRTHRSDQKEASLGREIRGIVIKQNLNPKTITVRAWWQTYDHRWKVFKKNGSSYQVHDEENFCRVGDIVVIKNMKKIGTTKNYYVRNILHQGPRGDLWNDLDKEVSDLASQKLYYTKEDEKKYFKDDLRLKSMREHLRKIKGLGLFDQTDVRTGK